MPLGYEYIPGIWNEDQISAWKKVPYCDTYDVAPMPQSLMQILLPDCRRRSQEQIVHILATVGFGTGGLHGCAYCGGSLPFRVCIQHPSCCQGCARTSSPFDHSGDSQVSRPICHCRQKCYESWVSTISSCSSLALLIQLQQVRLC